MSSLQLKGTKRVYNIHTKKPISYTHTHENPQIPYEHMNPKLMCSFTKQLFLCN